MTTRNSVKTRVARTEEIIGDISSDILFADAMGCFNGSVDFRAILSICKDFKLQPKTIPNKNGVAATSKAVKDARNHLAHGDVSYSNFGSTILLPGIIEYKKDILDFLSFFVGRVEEYISNKKHKK